MPRIGYTYRTSHGPQGGQPNILVRIAVGVISALVLFATAFLGLFIFLAALGVVVVEGKVMAVRFKKNQRKLQDQERESRRDYIERESHYVWGRRYLLHVGGIDRMTLAVSFSAAPAGLASSAPRRSSTGSPSHSIPVQIIPSLHKLRATRR